MKALITGAKGFLGKNLGVALRRAGVKTAETDVDTLPEGWQAGVCGASVVFHLAGTNRPEEDGEFERGNIGSLATLFDAIDRVQAENEQTARPLVVLSSSTQASRDIPYGRSKMGAERALEAYSKRRGTPAAITACRASSASGASPTTTPLLPPSVTTSREVFRLRSRTRRMSSNWFTWMTSWRNS